jgi:hypothetical protein
MDDFDALYVLDRRLRNDSGQSYIPGVHYDPCHFFPLLYTQVVLSMGHQSRLVSVTHGMVEVWSNQHGRWILMDPELDQHYEKDGIPLNLVDMVEENFNQVPTRVRAIRGTQTSGESPAWAHLRMEEVSAEFMIKYCKRHVDLVDLRNDWMTNHYFRGHPARGERNSVVYSHPNLPTPITFEQRLRQITSDKRDFYWTLNQAEIVVERESAADVLKLAFDTQTPNFHSFAISLDGGAPMELTKSDFVWRLHPGQNSLSIYPMNEAKVRGIESRVRLAVRPITARPVPGTRN